MRCGSNFGKDFSMRFNSTIVAGRARLAASAALILAAATAASAGSDPSGVWINDTGRGAVEIKPCGAALCGHVVWVKDGADTKGCGRQIIGGATPAGSGRWDSGWIYSPEKRKNYDVELTPLKDGTLRVMGYAGTKLFSRTMIWTRAPADLQRCGNIEAKAAPATPTVAVPAPAAIKPVEPVDVKTATGKVSDPATASPTAVQPATAATIPGTTAKDGSAHVATAPGASADTAPPANSAPAPSTPDKPTMADNDADDEGGEKPGERRKGGGLKLGDLDLDKVFTKTKSGKCKLDLPWVKVQFKCDQD